MPNTFKEEFMPLLWLQGQARLQLVDELIKTYPMEPFLHYWRIASTNSASTANYYGTDDIQNSIEIIFADASSAGLYARSSLLYRAKITCCRNGAARDNCGNCLILKHIKDIQYYQNEFNQAVTYEPNFEELIETKKSKMEQINSLFVPKENNENALSLTSKKDLPCIYGFYGLFECAQQGYFPAHFELATAHYYLQAVDQDPYQPDQSLFYYLALGHLNEFIDYPAAQMQKIVYLLGMPPIMDENGKFMDAKDLVDYCYAFPLTETHEKYANSIESFKKNYQLLNNKTYQNYCILLGETALKLAINYYQCAERLMANNYDNKAIAFFKQKAEAQL